MRLFVGGSVLDLVEFTFLVQFDMGLSKAVGSDRWLIV
jgi:hypothetical protein